MKDDGNLYSADELIFTHISTTQPVTRTPDDGFLRDRAIYKKGDAEFFGLLVETSDTLALYKENGVNFWADKANVTFAPVNKITPDQAFLATAAGTYANVQILDPATGNYTLGTITIDTTGVTVGTVLFTFDSIKPDETSGLVEKAIYKNDTAFIGVEVNGSPKTPKIHIKDGKEYWANAGEVVFDPANHVGILNAYINDLKQFQTHVLGETSYSLKDNGNLHLSTGGDTLVYTYAKHLKTDATTFDRSKIVYKTTANKYVGIAHDVNGARITLYKNSATTPWDNESDITADKFVDANKVVAIGTWDAVGDIVGDLGGNIPACHISTTRDPDGNIYVLFRDRTKAHDNKAQVIKWNGAKWSFVGARSSLSANNANEVAIKSDSAGTLYASYFNDGLRKLGIRKFVKGGTTWENFGLKGGEFLEGSDSGPALTIGITDGVEYIYALVKVSGDIIATRRKTDGTGDWARLGGVIFNENQTGLAGSSIVLNKATGHPIVGIGGFGIIGGQEPKDIRVAEWNGSAWEELGAGTLGKGSDMSINVNSKDEIYVAYRDQKIKVTSGKEGRASVKKWTGSAWELVGPKQWSDHSSDWIRIRFYTDDVPLVIYGGDGGSDSQSPTRGYYFNEAQNTWIKLGSSDFISSTLTYYTDGVIDPENDDFYVAFRDRGSVNGLRVRKHIRVVPKAE